MEVETRSPFGTLLREFRLAAGLSQEALAERAQLSAEGISVLERGVRRAPYRETVMLLARALKLSAPDRERLEAAGRRSKPLPRRRASEHFEPGSDIARHDNLPIALTSFLGRESELAELGALLEMHRLVTLLGPGGVGKTRLATEAGAARRKRSAGGVWFVDLASLTDGLLVTRTVAMTLGVQETTSTGQLDAVLVEFLRSKRLILVLDNCEHLIAAVASLANTLLPRCPDLRLLATSREALRIDGEQCYLVPALPLPPANASLTVAAARTYPAVALFVDRACSVDPAFRFTDELVAPVTEICRRLDGLPLAIELAAARAPLLSPAQIASRLDVRFRLLGGGSRTALARQQTLRAAIDWSFDLLEPVEQTLFTRMGIFAGRFGLETVTAVCAEDDADDFVTLDHLGELIGKSLVVSIGAEAGRQRYRLLESTRYYARERLDASGETERLWRRLADHVRETVARAVAEGDRDGIRWADRVEAELDQVRAVLERTIVDGHDIVFGAGFVDDLWRFWLDTGKFLEVRRFYERILERAVELDDALLGRTLLAYGLLASRRWDVEHGRELLERALSLLRPLGEEHQVARALNGLAITCQELGDVERARVLYTESLEIIRRLGDTRALVTVLMNLGVLTEVYGADYERAEALYLECLGLARALGDTAQQAHVLQNLAELAAARDQYDLAIEYAEQSLPLLRAHRNDESVAVSQVVIGIAELARGQHSAARAVLREALPVLVALHRGAALVSLFVGLADLALSEARGNAGAQLIGFAQALAETIHAHATAKSREHSAALVARARDRLDAPVFEAYLRRGRSLTLAEAEHLGASI